MQQNAAQQRSQWPWCPLLPCPPPLLPQPSLPSFLLRLRNAIVPIDFRYGLYVKINNKDIRTMTRSDLFLSFQKVKNRKETIKSIQKPLVVSPRRRTIVTNANDGDWRTIWRQRRRRIHAILISPAAHQTRRHFRGGYTRCGWHI